MAMLARVISNAADEHLMRASILQGVVADLTAEAAQFGHLADQVDVSDDELAQWEELVKRGEAATRALLTEVHAARHSRQFGRALRL